MRILAFIAAAACMACAGTVSVSTPKITYRIVNDCYPGSCQSFPIMLPDGTMGTGVTGTVAPRIVADTVKAESVKGK